jgi:hypothetical protein
LVEAQQAGLFDKRAFVFTKQGGDYYWERRVLRLKEFTPPILMIFSAKLKWR